MISEAYYEFLIDLTLNNQKTWFDENRKRYERDVKKPFEQFVSQLIDAVSSVDGRYGGLEPKDVIFRINRDIRFAKDKTPYKTNRSCLIAIGGRRKMQPGGLYLELGPEHCGIYSGWYMPDREQLLRIREHLAANMDRAKAILAEPSFVEVFGEIRGEAQKRIPSHLKEAGEAFPLIYNTQFYVMHEIEPERSLEPDFIPYIIDCWKAIEPWNTFLGEVHREED
jgi:uncharacterized protein (TIGR02453 family)